MERKYKILVFIIVIVGVFVGLALLRNHVPQLKTFFVDIGIDDEFANIEAQVYAGIKGDPFALLKVLAGIITASVTVIGLIVRTGRNKITDIMTNVNQQKTDTITAYETQLGTIQEEKNKLQTEYDNIQNQFTNLQSSNTQLQTNYQQVQFDYITVQKKLESVNDELKLAKDELAEYKIQYIQQQKISSA